MLIIDLDDTIFSTKSMNQQIFAHPISVLEQHYLNNEPNVNHKELIAEAWTIPIDQVFNKYKTPEQVISNFYQAISNIDYQELKIATFDDYAVIPFIPLRKILVTTGLRELQLAKITALGIESHFESIYIDDPRDEPRQHKVDIFRQILNDTRFLAENVWVIGDNPDSEIKAGKTLNMKTIQRRSPSKNSSSYADYEIDSFEELRSIIRIKL